VVVASPDAPAVDVLINGTAVATSLVYRNSTGYVPVSTNPQNVEIQTVSNSSTIFQQTVTVTAGGYETLIITGSTAHLQSVLLTDGSTGSTITTTGDGNVRVVNASSIMGSADVYIVNAGTGLGGATPVAKSLAFGQVAGYHTVAIGNYQVFLTAPGTTNVDLNAGPLALTQSQFQTLVALDGIGGGVSYTVLTDQ
jgi:Domain of unknown function (DUF4397)